jgi:hypothetical protein
MASIFSKFKDPILDFYEDKEETVCHQEECQIYHRKDDS